MKNTLRQVFHSPKFLVGFSIFAAILLLIFLYPLFNPGNPLEMIGVGTFARPGAYVSLYDAVNAGVVHAHGCGREGAGARRHGGAAGFMVCQL